MIVDLNKLEKFKNQFKKVIKNENIKNYTYSIIVFCIF